MFPDRKVLKHLVAPSAYELDLLNYIVSEIKKFNALTQIGILKSFTSSPHAVLSYCRSLSRNGTAEPTFAKNVAAIVSISSKFAKLNGLATLLAQVKAAKGQDWRTVVFTTSRETQTSIEGQLSSMGIRFGLINGGTGKKNGDTLRRFRAEPPEINVIVSTEAGAEGVNLQVANVLINFDLPWNPMVVEQRIGRIQRLGSKHSSVVIYNLVLAGTFDETIVGRLIEKLQMASHAIGDIEALLETSGLGDGEDSSGGVEEQIRKLVLSSLLGQNVEEATRQAEASIETAKQVLAEQEKTINSLLGDMNDTGVLGPKSPDLPSFERSMSAKDFAIRALTALGGKLNIGPNLVGTVEIEGRTSAIALEGAPEDLIEGYANYRPGGTAFGRLTQRFSKPVLHMVESQPPARKEDLERIAKEWVKIFAGDYLSIKIDSYRTSFHGTLMIRVKAFVAHDSYEKLGCRLIKPQSQSDGSEFCESQIG
jgi:hypothetical protein